MHPHAFVVDELRPVSQGGSPYRGDNLATAHRVCNNWRKDKSVDEVKRLRAEAYERFGGWASPEDFVAKAKAAAKWARAKAVKAQPKVTTDW